MNTELEIPLTWSMLNKHLWFDQNKGEGGEKD